jgi:hypothetical protein
VGSRPAAPGPDPRLAELAAARTAIDAGWQRRELLRGDLPAAFATAVAELDGALAASDTARASAALEQVNAAIAGVVIDRAFVDQKLQRLNTRLQKLPADRRDEAAALLREVLALVHAGDHAGANRKLNQIAARLGAEP